MERVIKRNDVEMNIETKKINDETYYRSEGDVERCMEIQKTWRYKTPWVRLRDTSRYVKHADDENINNWHLVCPKCNNDSFEHVENLDSSYDMCTKCKTEYQFLDWAWSHDIALEQIEDEKLIDNGSIVPRCF